jgi:hypothetical protein
LLQPSITEYSGQPNFIVWELLEKCLDAVTTPAAPSSSLLRTPEPGGVLLQSHANHDHTAEQKSAPSLIFLLSIGFAPTRQPVEVCLSVLAC